MSDISYQRGFQEGYNKAQKEMYEILKPMVDKINKLEKHDRLELLIQGQNGKIVKNITKELEQKLHEFLIKNEALSLEGKLYDGFTLRKEIGMSILNCKDTYILEKNGKEIDFLQVDRTWI